MKLVSNVEKFQQIVDNCVEDYKTQHDISDNLPDRLKGLTISEEEYKQLRFPDLNINWKSLFYNNWK